MNSRIITDDLLKAAVGLRLDAGVSAPKIDSLIAGFMSGQSQGEDDVPRVGVQEVPPDRREEFLGALAALPSEPDYSPANAGRVMTASDVWPLRIAEDAMMHRSRPEAPSDPDGGPAPTDSASPSAPVGEISPAEVHEELQPVEVVDYTEESDAASPAEPAAAEVMPAGVADAEHKPAEPVDHVSDAVSPTINPEADSKEGASIMWDKGELERMKNDIGARRDAMLERHAKQLKDMILSQAEELKRLDADHKEIEALEQAIDTLSRKIKPASTDAAVASLEDERNLRQQGLP